MSRQMTNPQIILIGSETYSNGATTEAGATLYARNMKYIHPAQTNPTPAMMPKSSAVGMIQGRNRNARLAGAWGASQIAATAGERTHAAAR